MLVKKKTPLYINAALYTRVWDVADYVVPPAENGAFFVATNVIITPNQTRGFCPEDNFDVKGVDCSPDPAACDAEYNAITITGEDQCNQEMLSRVSSCLLSTDSDMKRRRRQHWRRKRADNHTEATDAVTVSAAMEEEKLFSVTSTGKDRGRGLREMIARVLFNLEDQKTICARPYLECQKY